MAGVQPAGDIVGALWPRLNEVPQFQSVCVDEQTGQVLAEAETITCSAYRAGTPSPTSASDRMTEIVTGSEHEMPNRWRGSLWLALLGVMVTACAGAGRAANAARDNGAALAWSRLPESPLRARHSPHALWVDDRLLVMGGRDTPACPPNAGCIEPPRPALRDGAAYDPTTRRWTCLADAPVPLGDAETAVVGDAVYWWLPSSGGGPPTFISYDETTDEWQRLARPPGATGDAWIGLVAAGDAVVAYRRSHEGHGPRRDLVYEAARQAWRNLPPDPIAPSFDRSMVWTGDRVVLLAPDLVDNPGAKAPSLYRAAALDLDAGSWRRLPDSEVVAGWPQWFAVADLVVNPAVGGADGGETNPWDHWYPYGGVLDPSAGEWSPLPDPPEPSWDAGPTAVDDPYIVTGQGWVLDVVRDTWTPLSLPDDIPDDLQAVAAGDGRVYLWGGVTWDTETGTLSAAGWVAPLDVTD